MNSEGRVYGGVGRACSAVRAGWVGYGMHVMRFGIREFRLASCCPVIVTVIETGTVQSCSECSLIVPVDRAEHRLSSCGDERSEPHSPRWKLNCSSILI